MKKDRVPNDMFGIDRPNSTEVPGEILCEYAQNPDNTVSLCLFNPERATEWIEYTADDFLI